MGPMLLRRKHTPKHKNLSDITINTVLLHFPLFSTENLCPSAVITSLSICRGTKSYVAKKSFALIYISLFVAYLPGGYLA